MSCSPDLSVGPALPLNLLRVAHESANTLLFIKSIAKLLLP